MADGVSSGPDPAVPPGIGYGPSASVGTVAREWGRIGIIGFGGPPAHVALLRELAVERRGWLSPREFEDANAACGLLPGPASTQLAIYCAGRVAGTRGALVGGLAFIVPGLVLVVLLAALALAEDPPRWIRGLGAGAGAAAVAVVLEAGLALGRASVGGRRGGARIRTLLYVAAGTLAAVFAGPAVVFALLGCGVVEILWRRRAGGTGTAGLHLWPLLALLVAATSELPALAWTALKVGALSYGGGFVIIPLMRADAVESHGWMDAQSFVDAVAFGQLTPGPVVHTVAFVGWAAAGLTGALLAAAVAFAPSFALVGLGGPRFARLRASATARGFLDGAGPAGVGAILGAAWPLLAALDVTWQWLVLAGAGLLLAAGRSAAWALLLGAAAGLGASLAGSALP